MFPLFTVAMQNRYLDYDRVNFVRGGMARMHVSNTPRVTIENVTYVRFSPTYAGPVESKEQVELRLLALSYAAANRQLRMELETAIRLIARANGVSSETAYAAVSAALLDRREDSGYSSQALPRASETS